MPHHTILIASSDEDLRQHLAAHLDADGHTVHNADSTASTTAKLTSHAIDILALADLQGAAHSLALLREIRAGQLHPRIHPAQPVITLGDADQLAGLHAYESGSDHHLSADTGYVVLRAVLATILRRALQDITSRHLHVGVLHLNLAARTVDINTSSSTSADANSRCSPSSPKTPAASSPNTSSSAPSGAPRRAPAAARWTATPAAYASACATPAHRTPCRTSGEPATASPRTPDPMSAGRASPPPQEQTPDAASVAAVRRTARNARLCATALDRPIACCAARHARDPDHQPARAHRRQRLTARRVGRSGKVR